MLSYTECPICSGTLKVKRDRWFSECKKCGMHFRKWGAMASCTSGLSPEEEDRYARWEPMGDYETAMIALDEEFPGIAKERI